MKLPAQSFRIVIPVRFGKLRGAGDAVAIVAEPVKHIVQRLRPGWNCGGCEERRAWLNEAVKFKPQ